MFFEWSLYQYSMYIVYIFNCELQKIREKKDVRLYRYGMLPGCMVRCVFMIWFCFFLEWLVKRAKSIALLYFKAKHSYMIKERVWWYRVWFFSIALFITGSKVVWIWIRKIIRRKWKSSFFLHFSFNSIELNVRCCFR